MMTMVPLDNHICFVAISLHAKILYGNESIAALLGYKSAADISGKLTLPQLMTIPCQQLHQNFFKVIQLPQFKWCTFICCGMYDAVMKASISVVIA